MKWRGIIGAITFFTFCPFLSAQEGRLKVHFINVGYGDSILLENPDKTTWLIDAAQEKKGQALWAYLKKHKIRSLDRVFITHPHENHFGGLNLLIKKIRIKEILITKDPNPDPGFERLLKKFESKGIPVTFIKQGSVLSDVKHIKLDFLNPDNFQGSLNDNSLVTFLTHGKISFLLTADIGPEKQEELVKNFPEIRAANLVQIPHHGLPVQEPFLKTFGKNTVFVVSTGLSPYNPSGIEVPEGLEKILRTDRHGDIVAVSDGGSIQVFYGLSQ